MGGSGMGGYGRDGMGMYSFVKQMEFSQTLSNQSQTCFVLFLKIIRVVMDLLEEWEWGTITVEDTELLMAWVVMVSVFGYSGSVCQPPYVVQTVFYFDNLLLNTQCLFF